MSNKKRNRKTNLDALKLVTPEQIFYKNKKGEWKVKSKYKVFGSLERNSSMIVKQGPINQKYSFVEDIHKLPNRTKNKIVNYFENQKTKKGRKRQKVYLVDEKKK